MRGFVKQTISQCIEYQKAGFNENSQPTEELHSLTPTVAFARWDLDFIDPLPETSERYKWIVVGIDYATKWSIAKALKEATAKETANFIYSDILMQFGCPQEILTDRGSQFMSEVFEGYLDLQKVKHLRTSAYHPRTNGMVERLNGLIKSMMTKYVVDYANLWNDFLPQVLFSSRVCVDTATKFSPFILVYGVDPKLPGDTLMPCLF